MFSGAMKRFILYSALSWFVLVAGSTQADYGRNINSPVGYGDNVVTGTQMCVGHPAGLIPYHKLIYSKALKYQVEPLLVQAMIQVESSGRSRAVSRRGAKGLMQLMPATARHMKVKNPFNPEENIEGGVKYLRYLLDRFDGDVSFALAAYNAGPERIERFGGIPPIRETQQYVDRVLSIYIEKSLHTVYDVERLYM